MSDHVVYVSSNTEYHMFDERCVAVVRRSDAAIVPNHLALGAQLVGSRGLGRTQEAAFAPRAPRVGEQLCLYTGTQYLCSSRVDAIRSELQAAA
jgi:hypothetical protein